MESTFKRIHGNVMEALYLDISCSGYRDKQLHDGESNLLRVRPERAEFYRRHGLFIVALHDASGVRGHPPWGVRHGAGRRRQPPAHAPHLHRLLSSR